MFTKNPHLGSKHIGLNSQNIHTSICICPAESMFWEMVIMFVCCHAQLLSNASGVLHNAIVGGYCPTRLLICTLSILRNMHFHDNSNNHDDVMWLDSIGLKFKVWCRRHWDVFRRLKFSNRFWCVHSKGMRRVFKEVWFSFELVHTKYVNACVFKEIWVSFVEVSMIFEGFWVYVHLVVTPSFV